MSYAKIQKLIEEHGYMSGVDRMSDRVKATGEVFTPASLVVEMIQKFGEEAFAPGKTVLEPSCGDGQFIVGVFLTKRFFHKMSAVDAMSDIYGVELMADNAKLCRRRLWQLAKKPLLKTDKPLTDQEELDMAHVILENIIIGNMLEPLAVIEGQSALDRARMRELFEAPPKRMPEPAQRNLLDIMFDGDEE